MPTLREIIEAKGYTTRMLVELMPAFPPIPLESRRSWLNKWLKEPRQQHIYIVMGLPVLDDVKYQAFLAKHNGEINVLPNLSDRESKS